MNNLQSLLGNVKKRGVILDAIRLLCKKNPQLNQNILIQWIQKGIEKTKQSQQSINKKIRNVYEKTEEDSSFENLFTEI